MTMNKEQIWSDIDKRIDFIREVVAVSGARGIVFGNSGGKDSALVGILCKMACEDTLGVIMPCESKQNYTQDRKDAESLAAQFRITTKIVELTQTKQAIVQAIAETSQLTPAALNNIAPRLRMTTLYAIAGSDNRLVAGTGNRSESHMGYFTKWGDGAYDFNPISDLTVTEIYAYLRLLNAPSVIIEKAPSAGLFDGQTDEIEMGISYLCIDHYLLEGDIAENERRIIEHHHTKSEHKRNPPRIFTQGSKL